MPEEISPIIIVDRFNEIIQLLREISNKIAPTQQTSYTQPEIVVQPPEVTVRPEVRFPSLTTRFLRQIDEKHLSVNTENSEEYTIPQYDQGVTLLIYADTDIYISFLNPIGADAYFLRKNTPFVIDIIGHPKIYVKAKSENGNVWIMTFR